METELDIGDVVYDILTKKTRRIIGIRYRNNNFYYWIDSLYLDGVRNIWEIEKVNEQYN